MNETFKLISLFLVAIVAIIFSRAVGNPEAIRAEGESLQAALSKPVFKDSPEEEVEEEENNYLRRKTEVAAPEILAETTFVKSLDSDSVFLRRNTEVRRPIASITKLFTAAVFLENSSLNDPVGVSSKAVETEGTMGGLVEGETLSADALLHAMLLESSNDAAVALAEHAAGDTQSFVRIMNEKASSLGLVNTIFSDPSGLDDEKSYSTAEDLAKIVSYIRSSPSYEPIWNMLKKPRAVFYSAKQNYYEFLSNNPFVSSLGGFIGAKTGYTEGAGESMVMIVKSPDSNMEILYIVLGSLDRFGDMEFLVDWVSRAYQWEK